jgi:hypothetical protein
MIEYEQTILQNLFGVVETLQQFRVSVPCLHIIDDLTARAKLCLHWRVLNNLVIAICYPATAAIGFSHWPELFPKLCKPTVLRQVITLSENRQRQERFLRLILVVFQILYGYETWSLTLREEHRLRVFENRVLRRIFGPKRDEVTGGWRKLHNVELNNLYFSPSIIRMIQGG